MEMFKVRNLSFSYPSCEKKTLSDISFSVEKGEFIALCGATGSGKSTLLRMLKRELTPKGEKSGEILFCGTPLEKLSDRDSSSKIGFVMQNPEHQLVTDKVWHELAFGLENLGTDSSVIHSRIAEISAYFGIEKWFDKKVSELSGGQKQLLNLASVMAMNPEALILDEPTAQLDPIASADFIATVKKLNRELGITVIMVEHRLEEVIPVSDRLMILEKGRILFYDKPKSVIGKIGGMEKLINLMPSAVRLYHSVKGEGECPVDVREGRSFLTENFDNRIDSPDISKYTHSDESALSFKEVCFRYEKNDPDVLRSLSFDVYEGEIFSVLGGNGSGKTTALNLSAGLFKPYSGKISVFGKPIKSYRNQSLYRDCLALLPQDVGTVFLKNTVGEELSGAGEALKLIPVDLSVLFDKHPYDLSGGEQQLVALAKVLACKPKLLLMDEPTKGLDANARLGLSETLKKLKAEGITIVLVTHDAEFAAVCADRCGLFFRGEMVSVGTPRELFSGNNFYTTAISRITRGYFRNTVTLSEAAELCLKNGKRSENDSNKK